MSIIKAVVRWCAYTLLSLGILLIVLAGYFFGEAIYYHYRVFPQQADAWATIRGGWQQPSLNAALEEYRGVLHSHSYLSHDSTVSYEQILSAAKIADIDFLFLSNHCTDGLTNYAAGWSGLYDDVLFVRGHEGAYGFLSWGLPVDAVLDCTAPAEQLASEIVARGGMLFYAHSEDERLWDHGAYSGMEIYNIHTDLKDGERYAKLIPHMLLSGGRYPDQVMRLIFDRQTAILKHWDELNLNRKVVGIAANDAHQNNGIRAIYTPRDSLLLRLTSPDDVVGEWPLNVVTRTLLEMIFGALEPGRELFRFEMDPYERSLRYVNTHILSASLSERDLSDSLREGRAFIAFDAIADARGFVFQAQLEGDIIGLGESRAFQKGMVLQAASPYRVRYSLIRNGVQIDTAKGRDYHFEVELPGNYRIEAELEILGQWVPWVYSNAIYLEVPELSAKIIAEQD